VVQGYVRVGALADHVAEGPDAGCRPHVLVNLKVAGVLARHVQEPDGVDLQTHRERGQAGQDADNIYRQRVRHPHGEKADLRDQCDPEHDRHTARPRLDDTTIFHLFIAAERLQYRHRQRTTYRERGERYDHSHWQRPSRRASAGDTQSQEREVPGLSRREDLPEGQEGDRVMDSCRARQRHEQPIANCEERRRRVRGRSVHDAVMHGSSWALARACPAPRIQEATSSEPESPPSFVPRFLPPLRLAGLAPHAVQLRGQVGLGLHGQRPARLPASRNQRTPASTTR
jgi:hypothetical protein